MPSQRKRITPANGFGDDEANNDAPDFYKIDFLRQFPDPWFFATNSRMNTHKQKWNNIKLKTKRTVVYHHSLVECTVEEEKQSLLLWVVKKSI